MHAPFADVVLPFHLPRVFTYRVPPEFSEEARPGVRVTVNFGKRKLYAGILLRRHDQHPGAVQPKDLLEVLDERPLLEDVHLDFWQWMAAYYGCSLGDVMAAALPAHFRLESTSRIVRTPADQRPADAPSHEALRPDERILLETLARRDVLTLEEASNLLNRRKVFPLVQSLVRRGLVQQYEDVRETFKPLTEKRVRLQGVWASEGAREALFEQLERAPKQQELMLHFFRLQREAPYITARMLGRPFSNGSSLIRALEEKGILETEEVDVSRLKETGQEVQDFRLTAPQRKALEALRQQFEQHPTVLLHGVTASGKTLLYVQLIREQLEEGRQVLYLVPEIALTTQLIDRLNQYFGGEVAIYHSRYGDNERVEVWNRVRDGRLRLVVGARSAVFLPFRDLGMVVIDEEHDGSFKQQEPAPRYHARDASLYLAALFGARTLMGTATPAYETLWNVRREKFGYVALSERYQGIQMPEIRVADLRPDYKAKRMRSHFGQKLYEAMQQTLADGKQVILFQNRRGFAPFMECKSCGWISYCRHCDITLTYHRQFEKLICHYCGYHEPVPTQCPKCGSAEVLLRGYGTEKLEDELQLLFPEYKVLRLDQDATRGKQGFQKIIHAFETGEAQILVGTQMVTKGLDFSQVKLVGVVNADQLLRYPDFRAYERALQLLIQVSGRAGRFDERGTVVIQTTRPDHAVYEALLKDDYLGFFEREIDQRQLFLYPPFYRLIEINVKHHDLERVKAAADALAGQLRPALGSRVLGPQFPSVARLRGKYIQRILLKLEKGHLSMADVKRHLMGAIQQLEGSPKFRSVQFLVDVDPY